MIQNDDIPFSKNNNMRQYTHKIKYNVVFISIIIWFDYQFLCCGNLIYFYFMAVNTICGVSFSIGVSYKKV